MSRGPSQATPANGSANVSALIATSNWPSPTSSKANVPSASVVVNATSPPSAFLSSTVTPGRPTSSGSTSPGVPPPGLKSLQTTPLMPPWSGSGRTAWTASSGTSSPEIRVSPSEATLPASTGSASSIPPSASPTSASVDGAASESTPGGLIASFTPAMAALIAPCSGSCWYMIRQVTPAANAEIAIGMKTAVLNATDQPTRSVRTAKMSPMAVTSAGTTSTQIALFLTAVKRTSLVKICS